MCTDSSTECAKGWGFRAHEPEAVVELNLDPAVRRSLADAVTRALEEAVADSSAGLRGSLARGTSDPYSDIDVFWELPDAQFHDAIDDLSEILGSVGPIESIRADPLLQNSDKRQLIFVQFADLPLYWRVDIEVFAASIERDDDYDLDNIDARGDHWSLTHSALANGVAALKSLLRGDPERAHESRRLCAGSDHRARRNRRRDRSRTGRTREAPATSLRSGAGVHRKRARIVNPKDSPARRDRQVPGAA